MARHNARNVRRPRHRRSPVSDRASDSRSDRRSAHTNQRHRRVSGSIFTSVRPPARPFTLAHHSLSLFLSRNVRLTRCHTALTYTHRCAHTRVLRTRRVESAHERHCDAALTRAVSRRRLQPRNRILPGTRLRLGKFYIFCRRVVSILTAGDFNISVAAAIFAFDSSLDPTRYVDKRPRDPQRSTRRAGAEGLLKVDF